MELFFSLLRNRRNRYIVGVIALCSTFTLFLYSLSLKHEHDLYHQRFDELAGRLSVDLQRSVRESLRSLEELRTVLVSSPDIGRGQFDVVARSIVRNHPEIISAQWVPRVWQKDRRSFEERARGDGVTTFRISEHSPYQPYGEAGEREVYYPILYTAPFSPTEMKRLGYDLGSDAFYRDTLNDAVDSGQPRITSTPSIIQTDGPGTMITAFQPVYRLGELPSDPKERRRALTGLIVASIHVGKLLESFRQQLAQRTTFYVYDHDRRGHSEFLYMFDSMKGKVFRTQISPGEALADRAFPLRVLRSVPVGGRQWNIVFLAQRNDLSTDRPESWRVIVHGLSLMVLLVIAVLFMEGDITPRTVAQAREANLRAEFGKQITEETSRRSGIEREIDDLRRSIRQRTNERDSIVEELDRERAQLKERNREIARLTSDVQRAQSEKLALGVDAKLVAEAAEKHRRDAERRIRELEIEARGGTKERNEEVRKLAVRLSEEQKITGGLLEQISRLKAENAQLVTGNLELEAKLASASVAAVGNDESGNGVKEQLTGQIQTIQQLGHQLAEARSASDELTSVKRSLQTQLTEKAARIRALEEKIHILHEKIDYERKRVTGVDQELTARQEKIETLERQLAMQVTPASTPEERTEVEALQNERENLLERLRLLVEENRELEHTLEIQVGLVSSLREDLSRQGIKGRDDKLEPHDESETRRERDAQRKELGTLRQEIARQREVASVERIAVLRTTDTLRQEAAEKGEELSRLKEELERLRVLAEQHERAHTEGNQSKRTIDHQRQELAAQREQTEVLEQQLAKERELTEVERHAAERTIEMLTREREEERIQVRSLESALEREREIVRQREFEQTEHAAAKRLIEELKHGLDDGQLKIAELEQQLAKQVEVARVENTAQARTVEKIRQDLNSRTAQVAALEDQLAEQRLVAEQRLAAEAERIASKQQLDELRTTLAERGRHVSDLEVEVGRLRDLARVEEASAGRSQTILQQELSDAQAQRSLFEQELGKQREVAKVESASAKRVIDRLKRELSEKQERLSAAEQGLVEQQDLAKEISTRSEERARLEGVVAELTAKLNRSGEELAAETAAAQSVIAKLEGDLVERNKQIALLEAELAAIQPSEPLPESDEKLVENIDEKLAEQQEIIRVLQEEVGFFKQSSEERQAQQDDLERKVAERSAALAASEARYQTLTEVSPLGIFFTDLEGRCLYANEQFTDISGLSLDEVRGEGWLLSVHEEDRESVRRAWQRAIRERRKFVAEFRYPARDGTVRRVLARAIMQTQDTQAPGFVGTIVDISSANDS